MSSLHLSIDVWLEKLHLSVYRSLFKDYSAVEDILWMSERDLKEIGIKNGSHRACLATSLTILKEKYDKYHQFLSPDRTLKAKNERQPRNSLSPPGGVRSWPSTAPSSTFATHSISPRSPGHYSVTDMSLSELKAALEAELKLDTSDLRSHAWYHGTIPRQRAEELIAEESSFLVRDCVSQPGDYVISCRWKGAPLHFVIKKILTNAGTVYEKMEFFFEKESFASIPDFITYYVGSSCPLSEASGAVISKPVNRTMPLTYYASRYGVQCQIHYAAVKLEALPTSDKVAAQINISPSKPANSVISNTLTRVGSDPMISPNVDRKKLDPRPNSGSFCSDMKLVSSKSNDTPPPKPSRIPSKKYAHRPIVLKRSPCVVKEESPPNYKRQQSETRSSFLDRKSDDDLDIFAVPSLNPPSAFLSQDFNSPLLNSQNLPLEGIVLNEVKRLILCTPSNILAAHVTRKDLDVARILNKSDLGLGVYCGLELLFLPQGEQLQKDLLERAECIKLFVAVTLLTSPEIQQRVQLLCKWIDVANEIKKSFGDFYGFTCILLGLTLPEILGLSSTWLALRQHCTDWALTFETKLRPSLRNLQLGSGLEAPNTSFPYLLSLITVLQRYIQTMTVIEENPFSSESIIQESIPNLKLFGENSSDYGLQLLTDHLQMGRCVMQCHATYAQNGELLLQSVEFDDTLLALFSTEFHQRMLWGYRGCIVCPQERFQKFQKVLNLLYNKCNESVA